MLPSISTAFPGRPEPVPLSSNAQQLVLKAERLGVLRQCLLLLAKAEEIQAVLDEVEDCQAGTRATVERMGRLMRVVREGQAVVEVGDGVRDASREVYARIREGNGELGRSEARLRELHMRLEALIGQPGKTAWQKKQECLAEHDRLLRLAEEMRARLAGLAVEEWAAGEPDLQAGAAGGLGLFSLEAVSALNLHDEFEDALEPARETSAEVLAALSSPSDFEAAPEAAAAISPASAAISPASAAPAPASAASVLAPALAGIVVLQRSVTVPAAFVATIKQRILSWQDKFAQDMNRGIEAANSDEFSMFYNRRYGWRANARKWAPRLEDELGLPAGTLTHRLPCCHVHYNGFLRTCVSCMSCLGRELDAVSLFTIAHSTMSVQELAMVCANRLTQIRAALMPVVLHAVSKEELAANWDGKYALSGMQALSNAVKGGVRSAPRRRRQPKVVPAAAGLGGGSSAVVQAGVAFSPIEPAPAADVQVSAWAVPVARAVPVQLSDDREQSKRARV